MESLKLSLGIVHIQKTSHNLEIVNPIVIFINKALVRHKIIEPIPHCDVIYGRPLGEYFKQGR